jgi:hypothetical protein
VSVCVCVCLCVCVCVCVCLCVSVCAHVREFLACMSAQVNLSEFGILAAAYVRVRGP